jgi:hypothetical protein
VPKGPDALIAAPAIVYNIPLVSNNDRDFVWISRQFGFTLINPIQDNEVYQQFQDAYKKKRGLI